jgi:hypothetical protein
MLVEALVYALSFPATPAPFRRHLAEAVGLWARGERQAAAWAPHIGATRALIDRGIDRVAPRRTVAVLGSGPLFDVPLEALARTFSRVLLIDQAHLATTRRRVRRYPNVRQEWRDLSAAANPRHLEFLGGVADLDWVISVNLLSQLGRAAPEGEERAVIDAHLAALDGLPCPVTLVTDLGYQVVDQQGRLMEQFDLLHGRPMPGGERWLWEVAPFGEEAAAARRVHQVAGWAVWKQTAASQDPT